MKFLYTIFLALVLNGAQPVWNPSTHAVVDCAAGEWDKAAFTSIQKALDTGATWIEVRPCVYDETLTISTEGVTIDAQGAVLLNDGTSTSIVINAPNVTIRGDLTLQGMHDGSAEGDFFQGVGIRVTAPYTHIEGITIRNLRSFGILLPEATAHHATIEDFTITNVATERAGQLYASKGILLINGASYNTIRNGYVSGHAQAVGVWYGASHNTIEGNRFENNWGYVGNGNGYVRRSVVEEYGTDAPTVGNQYLDNRIDGGRNSGFELADNLVDTVVRGNEVRNVGNGFGAMGSGSNRGLNLTIEGNTFYGDSDGADDANWFSGTGAIRGNRFIDYYQNNIGTIHIPHDALGDVDVTGNQFVRNGRVLRSHANAGTLRILDNRISEPRTGTDAFVFQDNSVGAEIAGNVIPSNGGYPIASNRAAPLWIHHNQIQGQINIRAGVIEANTIQALPNAWHPVIVYPGMLVRDNRIASDTPLHYEGGAAGAVVTFNYLTRTDGGPVAIPACPPAAACLFNWTAGETPP